MSSYRRLAAAFPLALSFAIVGCFGDPAEVSVATESDSSGSGSTAADTTAATAPADTTSVAEGSGGAAPDCDNPTTLACVCGQDPSCCAFDWTDECIALVEGCGSCEPEPTDTTSGAGSSSDDGGMRDSPCCEAMGGPGCAADPETETCVCTMDPFCCDTQWDDKCVATAINGCGIECDGGGSGGGGGGDCCTPGDGPGCDTPEVSECVCDNDAFCCDMQWDDLCVGQAQYLCEAECGLPEPGGDCCVPNEAPSCDDADVTSCVCDAIPQCCYTPWADFCVTTAVSLCDIECRGVDPISECCFPGDEPGCVDEMVEECVCDEDPLCCDAAWDGVCVGIAAMQCGLACGFGMGGGGMGGG